MDDDYVARVLAKEARDSSQKYTTEGLGAYMPKRPAGNAPKPNTRFLRHLIKETDSHNTALKRKEEREARERMRAMKDQSKADSTSTSHSSRRPDRSSTTRDSEQQRKQDREDRHRSHRRRDRSRTTSTDREHSRRHRHRDEKDRRRTTDDRDRGEHTERRRDRRRHESSRQDRRHRERSYSRSRSRSPRRERDHAYRSHRSERSRRSESPPARSSHSRTKRESEPRSRRDEHTSSRQRRLSPREPTKLATSKTSSSATLRNEESDESDPLEDLVGPLPVTDHSSAPVRSRGRGAYKPSTSNIDAHFAPDYDPTLDVQPDEEDDAYGAKTSSRRHVPGLTTGEDDWDMALEALRDRARWKQKGEDRLRAAGINEDAINRWKTDAVSTSQNDERRPEDVRWSTKDEGREWDRGKFVNDDGHIDVRAAWSK
ncbi:hypothetical protein N7488_004349 [Penicillium malachiteum]|nr:hypothetical protein N7488_004349 [Penicillium malachiteum]